MKRTFTTRTPDKPGAFMQACRVIKDCGGNITRVSYKRGALNLFIEVEGTRQQLKDIEVGLGRMDYVDLSAVEPVVLVMEIKMPDIPGALFPVLETIDRFEVNISYLNSRADDNSDRQYFNIGMEVKDPATSKAILDEVGSLYMLNVISYNGSDADLDCTVGYIRLANKIQKLFSLDDARALELIAECRDAASLMKSKGQNPDSVFGSILRLAEFIAYHRDLSFKPRITQRSITPETDLISIEPPCGSNTYVLRNGDDLLFIDTGMGIYSDEMITELRETFPAFFSMGKTVLVTHADADRCGLLSVLENAKILVSAKAEARLFDMAVSIGDEDPYNYCYARLSRIITDYVPPERSAVTVIGGAPKEHDGFELLHTLRFGDLDLEIYEGPGLIARGESVILCREPKLLFTGDIYSNSKDVIPERAEFNQIAPFVSSHPEKDLEALASTRSKLGELIDSVGREGMSVCGGHGGIKRLRGGKMNDTTEIAQRIRAMRDLCGITTAEMAEATGVTEEEYIACEEGKTDFPFTFLFKCADRFNIDAVELITGENPRLKDYMVVHDGMGLRVQRWTGFDYRHLAPYFADKAAEPFLVRAPYVEEDQEGELHAEAHEGQKFVYIISGSLRFVYDGHEENLIAGDSIYFDATKPHGMAATSKDGCEFLVIIIKGGRSRWSGTSTCATSTRPTTTTAC